MTSICTPREALQKLSAFSVLGILSLELALFDDLDGTFTGVFFEG